MSSYVFIIFNDIPVDDGRHTLGCATLIFQAQSFLQKSGRRKVFEIFRSILLLLRKKILKVFRACGGGRYMTLEPSTELVANWPAALIIIIIIIIGQTERLCGGE